MAIYGNVIGGNSSAIGKTFILQDPSGIEIIGVVTESEQVLTAKPSDVRIGKTVVTSDGVIEGTNTITYRTEMAYRLILPGQAFSIPLSNYNRYDYTKFQCVIVLFSSEYGDTVETMGVTIGDSVYSTQTTEKLSDITKNSQTQSIDLNITNDTDNIYEIFYFTLREDKEEEL